jgi:hypothetical protein
MKTILKYLVIFATLIVPVLLFPNRVSLVLLEYTLTVLVISSIILSRWLWWIQRDQKQYTTWIVSFFVAFVPWLFNFSIFKSASIFELPIYTMLIGFVANGMYGLSWVKKFLKWIGVLKILSK